MIRDSSRGCRRLFSFAAVTLLLALRAPAGDDMATNAAPEGLAPGPDTVMKEFFGRIPHGAPVTLYILTNKNGMSVSIMDYGATITSIKVPDRDGKIGEIALGFDRFAPYLGMKDYFGATVGRFANRIAKGTFALDKITYHLPCNELPRENDSLHGGVRGFDKRMWNFEPVEADEPAVRFTYLSKDGEEGYPGNLFVSVTYSLSDDNELKIDYQASTDKPTILNLANHSYFNLAGAGNGTILDEMVTIHADKFTPVDDTLIPTGEIKDVAGTPYDFRQPTAIGAHIKELTNKPQGYDFNYVLNKGYFSNNSLAAVIDDPNTGRRMEVTTDQPGLQFYTGNFLTGSYVGHDHKRYPQYGAIVLETQHFPDSPNHDNFPSTVLRPGDDFKSTTVYAFSVEK